MAKVTKPPNPSLLSTKDCIVTFLDILGFRELVSSTEANYIARILDSLRYFGETDKTIATTV